MRALTVGVLLALALPLAAHGDYRGRHRQAELSPAPRTKVKGMAPVAGWFRYRDPSLRLQKLAREAGLTKVRISSMDSTIGPCPVDLRAQAPSAAAKEKFLQAAMKPWVRGGVRFRPGPTYSEYLRQ